ncbi:MAG: hypothetical protein Q8906_02795 [Bacillota bacterium]|nr:hypothetical protein [Bacillota bacterium]MDP4169510.1 hypothetical protein [Bacillota bacterium]
MNKKEAQKTASSVELDEQGINEVNEQIMDAYNSGFVNQQMSKSNENNEGIEGEI